MATGHVVVQAGFRSLGVRQKALAFHFGAEVAVLLGVAENEPATPGEVAAAGTGMPPGSVRPTMSVLAVGTPRATQGCKLLRVVPSTNRLRVSTEEVSSTGSAA